MTDPFSKQELESLKTRLVQFLEKNVERENLPGSLQSLLSLQIGKLIKLILSEKSFGQFQNHWPVTSKEDQELLSVVSDLEITTTYQVALLYEWLSELTLVRSPHDKLVVGVSKFKRRRQGQFYTPPKIARHISKMSLDALQQGSQKDLSRIDILDPSVGTGIFLIEAIEEVALRCGISSANRGQKAFISLDRIHGVDIDPIAIEIAKAGIWEKLRSRNLPHYGNTKNIRLGNSLIGRDPMSRSYQKYSSLISPIESINDESSGLSQSADTSLYEELYLDWMSAFPSVFERENPGFDLIIGNPPYEILSAKESKSEHFKTFLKFFRSNYITCFGKINTYRLMIEKSLNLLRTGGVLGFIVPATFLADSTALKLRSLVLKECEIFTLEIIPESARVFQGVTQALSIIVARKGKPSSKLTPVLWSDEETKCVSGKSRIRVAQLEKIGSRIPVLKSEIEYELLNHLISFPRLGGDLGQKKWIRAHQGEINLTNQRQYIAKSNTGIKLVRGEHILPYVVRHPSKMPNRMDWIKPKLLDLLHQGINSPIKARRRFQCEVSQGGRIAVARVVNMDCKKRLKAAWVNNATFLGDMTNYLDGIILSTNFTLGIINSKLLNWRFKVTSANNYVSASELENLPVPRGVVSLNMDTVSDMGIEILDQLRMTEIESISEAISAIKGQTDKCIDEIEKTKLLVKLTEATVSCLIRGLSDSNEQSSYSKKLVAILDAIVLCLYSATRFVKIFDDNT
ncbi:MAG: N-6 DNA methylase [Desulfomonilaceae bacterium]